MDTAKNLFTRNPVATLFTLVLLAPFWQAFVGWRIWSWFMITPITWLQFMGIVLTARVVLISHSSAVELLPYFSDQHLQHLGIYRSLRRIERRVVDEASTVDEPLDDYALSLLLIRPKDDQYGRRQQLDAYAGVNFLAPLAALGLAAALHFLNLDT
jgi:hypothetical protein